MVNWFFLSDGEFRTLGPMKKLWQVLVSLALAVVSCLPLSCRQKNGTGPNMANDTAMSLVVREWSKKINQYPDHHEYYYERAKALAKERLFKLAEADLTQALKLVPGKIEYLLMKGDMLFAYDQTRAALLIYQDAAKRNPEHPDALYKVGQFNLFVKRYPEAERYLKELLKISPSRPDVYFMLGTVYKEMNDTSKALLEFKNSVKVDPEFYNSYMQLGLLLSERNDTNALAFFGHALRVDEFSDEAYYGRGFLYQKIKNNRLAAADYKKAIDINPTHKLAYYNLANINAELGRYDLALEQLLTLLKFAPDFSKAYNRAGQLYELTGEWASARQYYEKCLSLDSTSVLATEGLQRLQKKGK
jgi:tetratricopeptide (TPR) repeat protein